MLEGETNTFLFVFCFSSSPKSLNANCDDAAGRGWAGRCCAAGCWAAPLIPTICEQISKKTMGMQTITFMAFLSRARNLSVKERRRAAYLQRKGQKTFRVL